MHTIVFKLKAQDRIWMELKATFDFEMYVMDPGYAVFVPLNVWPKSPSYTELSNEMINSEIQLNKESTVLNEGCNNTEGYVYGGRAVFHVICTL